MIFWGGAFDFILGRGVLTQDVAWLVTLCDAVDSKAPRSIQNNLSKTSLSCAIVASTKGFDEGGSKVAVGKEQKVSDIALEISTKRQKTNDGGKIYTSPDIRLRDISPTAAVDLASGDGGDEICFQRGLVGARAVVLAIMEDPEFIENWGSDFRGADKERLVAALSASLQRTKGK